MTNENRHLPTFGVVMDNERRDGCRWFLRVRAAGDRWSARRSLSITKSKVHLPFFFEGHVERLIVVVIQSNMTPLLRYIDHPSHLKPSAECVAVRKPFCWTARPKQCLGVAKCIDRSAQKEH